MSSKSGGAGGNGPDTVTICILGVSGTERTKGAVGVGKSLLCNRFVRGDYDSFHMEHSSVLSQTDFGGSPVINNDHWLYWGEAQITNDDLYANTQIRLIEQTEFVDDETFEPLEGASEDYAKRATRTKLDSADKLMYICKEQLGLEAEFEHRILPEGRVSVDAFVYVFDLSAVEGRSFERQSDLAAPILSNAVKTKKPVIIAASKADIADEDGHKALQKLVSRKELKSANIPVVEVSSVANINVTGLFAFTAAVVEKWKIKPKLLGFGEALKLQRKREREISENYCALLREFMPIESWLHSRPTWSKLLNRIGLAKQPAYTQYVFVFGRAEAKKLYQKHVNEAREFWMQHRLQMQAPRLTHVFEDLVGPERVCSLTWAEAKDIICRHPLFDEYFQPLGTLGADLDPSSPQTERNLSDSRIPAELLLTVDAEPAFIEFQRMVDRDCRRERLEEQFEQTLAQCAQVTPGKPLEEVDLFLRGDPSFDVLPTQLARKIYTKFQETLIRKAEADFMELLLERVQLFIDLVLKRRQVTHTMRPLTGLDDNEMSDLRNVLHEDARYRQLNRLFELRDKMLVNYASFVSYPLVQNCPAGTRCVDSLLHDIFHSHLQRRQRLESLQMLTIRLIVVGDERLFSDFNFAVSKMLRGGIMEHERGLARVICFREKEADTDAVRFGTWVFLVDSFDALERYRSYSLRAADFSCPPLVILVADPAQFDLLPVLHQQSCLLANSLGGSFIGSAPESVPNARRSSDNELNTLFTWDQVSRVLDGAFSSQTDGRRLDARIQLSLMCGDQFPAHCVLSSLLASAVHLTPSSSGGMATVEVPVPLLKGTARIDMRVSSYHSWLVSRAPVPINGHILAYSARRRASFEHAAAAARGLVASSLAPCGRAILFVAVADVTDFFNDEETHVLLTEGSELADELSAAFVTLSPEVAERLHTVTFREFFERILSVQLNNHSIQPLKYSRSHSGEYAAVTEMNQSGSANCTFGSGNTMLSGGTTCSHESTSSRNSTHAVSDSPVSRATTAPCSVSSTQRKEAGLRRITSAGNSVVVGDVPSAELSKAEVQQTAPAESVVSLSSPLRLSFAADSLSLPVESHSVAPLATPEHIEIANEYMTVKDAVRNDDDESVYATLDFSYTGSAPLRDMNANLSHKSPITEKAKNLITRFPRKHGANVTAPLSQIKPAPLSNISGSASSSSTPSTQPSSAGAAVNSVRHARIPALARHVAPASSSPSTRIIHRLHSISAESLVEVGLIDSTSLYGHVNDGLATDGASKKHSTNRFVRKVTSSFRFRKGARTSADKKILEEIEDEHDSSSATIHEESGSRSVPHSPYFERAHHIVLKRREPPSSSEKISNAFSWLPSRSPRRNARNTVVEGNVRLNGVVAPSDTLQSLAYSSADQVPVFVKKCIEYIEEEGGIDVEGLYRVPGNQAQVGELERAFLMDNTVKLHSLQLPVHVVATALKNFFSGLPEPLIPYDMHDALVRCVTDAKSDSLTKVAEALQAWPSVNRKTMIYLGAHLARVASRAAVNSMDMRNLAKVWWPTLFRPNFDSFESMAVFVTRLEMATQLLIRYTADRVL